MNSIINKINAEWQTNQRLQFMVYIIIATLMVYMLLWVADSIEQQSTKLSRQQTLLEKIKVIQNEPEWYERKKDAASYKVKLQSGLWQATSEGLAQAQVQAYLRSLISTYKLKNSRITLESVEERQLGNSEFYVWRVSAQVRASFQKDQLQKLLWSINTNPKLITVRTLNFALNKNKNSYSNLTLFVDGWFEATKGTSNE